MQRRLTGLACIVATVAGCATSIADLKERGTAFYYRSTLAPSRAASCISRAMETAGMGLAVPREAAVQGEWEVSHQLQTAYGGMLMAQPFMYAYVQPMDAGSRVTIWVTPINLDKKGHADAAMKGC